MAKKLPLFECSKCGFRCNKWAGKCPQCNEWSTLVEIQEDQPGKRRGLSKQEGAIPLNEVKKEKNSRIGTGNEEFDRTLGGGLAHGSLILIGGDPGIGKSTLLLQTMTNLHAAGENVLYVSGEESAEQILMRSERLQAQGSSMLVLCETNLEKILAQSKKIKPSVLVVDSIQTVFREDLPGTPGSVTQLRECTLEFMIHAKHSGCIIILVGHVTKEGQIAGPRIIEHMVDTVIYFEGDRNHQYRVLRAIKNRFGATDEIGVFEMNVRGLQAVKNPSIAFLEGHREQMPGSVLSCNTEGSRAFLFEVQALVSSTSYSVAQRVSTGLDQKRMTIILALLEKFGGLQIGNSDVFVSITGGIKVDDRGLDLALAVAIAGNFQNRVLPPKTVVMGELGLGGEVRPIAQMESRLKEIARLGFTSAILPYSAKLIVPKEVTPIFVQSLSQALEQLQ
jgi:DNA repair protein RadA/Sms